MRSRQRLIEVLNSVNRFAVTQDEWATALFIGATLKYRPNNLNECIATVRSRLISPLWIKSPHIRELLQEGLALLEADKLMGCTETAVREHSQNGEIS